MSPLDRFEKKVESMDRHDLLREPFSLASPQKPVVTKEGQDLICFASNNYLGLTTDPDVKQAATDAVERFGAGSGASRLITGTFSVHEKLEQEIASLKNTDDALLFGSGYLTNLGTILALAGSDTIIYSDESNHASIIDGIRLSGSEHYFYDHRDVEDLREKLNETGSDTSRRLVITDGVFSMDGDLAPLPELVDICEEHDALLMVDDAHGTGVLGREGRGTVDHFDLTQEEVPVQMGTLSKAVGAQGGFIAGPSSLIDYLRNRARTFIYSTAPPPAVAGASIEGIRKLRNDGNGRKQLHAHMNQLHSALSDAGFQVTPEEARSAIMSIVLGDPSLALAFSDQLEERGLLIPAVRPPTVPRGESRIRLTVMSTHTDDQILEAIETICRVADTMEEPVRQETASGTSVAETMS